MTRLTFTDKRAAFSEGNDTPRELLERCLARIEERNGQVHAFCFLNTEGARAAADASTARWRDGKPLSADRRHAGRAEGYFRDRRHADHVRQPDLRRLARRARQRGGLCAA